MPVGESSREDIDVEANCINGHSFVKNISYF